MVLKLYDLAGAEDKIRFSPYCWRVKMALKHKGLEVEEIPWRYVEKESIAFSNQKAVPVLVDGDKTVADSWDIACYLESKYPEKPSLFGGKAAESEALFIKFWCDRVINPLIFKIIVLDVFENLHEKDKAYFRQTREAMLGKTLEEFSQPNDDSIAALNQALEPLRATLKCQPYLGGSEANFADYIIFGAFTWVISISPIEILDTEDSIYTWRDRLLNAFDGYARNAVCDGNINVL